MTCVAKKRCFLFVYEDDRESPYAKRLVGEDKVAKKKKLPRNYDKALETIDKHLVSFSD